jgi:hypothetical protein
MFAAVIINSKSITNDVDDLNSKRIGEFVIDVDIGELAPKPALTFREKIKYSHGSVS